MYSAGNSSPSPPLPSTEACLARIPVLALYRETKLKSTFLASLRRWCSARFSSRCRSNTGLASGVKAHSLERQIEAAKLAERRAAVAEQVRKAYYRLLETQSALESVEQSLPLYRETVRLATVGLKLETVLQSERLKAEAEAAKVELEALKLRNPIATQIEALNELMGRPVNTPFRTVGVRHIAEERMNPEEAIQTALTPAAGGAAGQPPGTAGRSRYPGEAIRVHSRRKPGADIPVGLQLSERSASEYCHGRRVP